MRIAARIASIPALLLAAPLAAAPIASFDYLAYRALEAEPPTAEGNFRNPVLPGFHPDPSIVKVGKDFYLVSSTFSWFPGLPIFHSTDLVNWRLIGHAIDRPGQMDFSGLGTNRGLFAPAITHHNGKFWIVNTCIECGGNFVITAEKPEGPWSDPHWLSFGGIDPSLFFDADGSAWISYNDAPPGEPQYEGHRAIWIQRFDMERMQVLPERKLLVDGGVDITTKPVWAEGPHIYKIGEWYYLLTAEGGTADQHSQTIYRSRAVNGPYAPGPVNPILTQRNMDPDRPDRVEATGHADVVQLDDGNWWGVFLATRPFAGQSTLMGRETYLLPLRWVDGWPRFLDPGEVVPVEVKKPNLPASPGTQWRAWRDEFEAPLSAEWIGIRSPGTEQLVMVADGQLHLVAGSADAGGLDKPAFVGRRLRHHDAEYVTSVDFRSDSDGDFAGLLAFMDEGHFLTLGIEGEDIVARRRSEPGDSRRGEVVGRVPRTSANKAELRMQFKGGSADLAWRPQGTAKWIEVAGKVNVEPLASVHAGLFTGLVVGPYALTEE